MAKRKSVDADAATEPEGVDSALHPRSAEYLIGHAAAEAMFLSSYNAASLHHAWLLTGEKGIGKATFAYRAARFLLSRPADEGAAAAETLHVPATDPAARQVVSGAHLSLLVLDGASGKSSIGVDEVRKLRAFLGLTAPNGGWRALIVDPANDLMTGSANALLKAVEEPPPRTVFFLVNHGAATVMPTIRSRCVKLSMRPLAHDDFVEAFAGVCHAGNLAVPDGETLRDLFSASGGSPGRALDLHSEGVLEQVTKLDRIVADLPRIDYSVVHALIQSALGVRNAGNFDRLCDLIEQRIEQRARALAGDVARAGAWSALWQRVRGRRVEMETLNLDKGAFLMSAFSDMEQASREVAPDFLA